MSTKVIDPGINVQTYDVFNVDLKKIKSRKSNVVDLSTINESIPQSVINDEFVKKTEVPAYDVHQRQLKREREIERSKNKGKNWFHMSAPEMTEEKKNDLLAIEMRSGLYADKFFKKGSDTKGLPKFFHTGTVLDSPADFYRRIPKKDRKKTILEELYNDSQVKKFTKKRYVEIKENIRRRVAAAKNMKRLKNKKK